jgi:excisionase family DNA binding protein
MQNQPGISTAEAAARLGVHRTRVNKMIRDGLLTATRVGARFLVDPTSLDRRLAAEVAAGRPLTARNAWALLALASGDPAMVAGCAGALHPSARSRVQGRLRQTSIPALAPRLRSRAIVQRLVADQADLELLAAEPSLVRTGVSAAAMYRFDIAAPDVLEAYVPMKQVTGLVQEYFLEPSGRPNVILHVVESFWPFPPGMRVAPPVIAALDLFEADDARAKRAGREALQRLGTA